MIFSYLKAHGPPCPTKLTGGWCSMVSCWLFSMLSMTYVAFNLRFPAFSMVFPKIFQGLSNNLSTFPTFQVPRVSAFFPGARRRGARARAHLQPAARAAGAGAAPRGGGAEALPGGREGRAGRDLQEGRSEGRSVKDVGFDVRSSGM